MSPLRLGLLAGAALLLPVRAASAAGDPVMPLAQVQKGMHCTAYSVIQGTTISSFDALVDDVVSDGSGSSFILVSVSGPAVDDTGVGPGFSGSPVYCPSPADGSPEVAGALSEGIGAYDNKTLLATPVEAILGEPVTPPASARRAPAVLRGRRALSLPLSISGLSPAVGSYFHVIGRRAGRMVLTAPAAPRTDFPVQTLQPGSAMAVGYSSGDITSGAIGTVSYVDGPDVWAFGHPLDSVGRRALFLQDAYVYGVISSPSTGTGQGTYKLAAPGHDVGTLSGDGVFAVTGITGALPPHFPMTVTATDLDTGTERATHLELADERAVGNPTGLEPVGFVGSSAVAQAAYSILHGSPLNTSGDMCVAISVQERLRPMGFCNTYVAAGSGSAADGSTALASAPAVADFGSAAGLLDSYRLGPLHVTDVQVKLRLRRGLSQAFMVGLQGPEVMRRGHRYSVRLSLKRAGGASSTVSIRVPVPGGALRGRRALVLSGTPSDYAGGGSVSDVLTALLDGGAGQPDEAGPRNVVALARQIAGLHRYDGVTASFRARLRKGQAIQPPASNDALPPGAAGRSLRERPVYRDPDLRISGAVSLPVTIR